MKFIDSPSEIEACGTKPKIIKEFFGMVISNTADVSIAKMKSPQGWEEPVQTSEFYEYTIVLEGTLCVKTKESDIKVGKGQAITVSKGSGFNTVRLLKADANILLFVYPPLLLKGFTEMTINEYIKTGDLQFETAIQPWNTTHESI